MKNIFYLFLAVTIFACSSDDSSDTNDNNNNSSTKKIISIQVVEDVDNICLDGSNFTFSYSGDDITSLTRQAWASPCPNSNETSWRYTTSMVTNYIYSSNKIVVSSEFDYNDGFEYYFDDNGLLTTISITNSGEVYDDVIFQNGKLLALSGYNFVWLNNNLVQTSISNSNTMSYNYSNIDNKTDFITQIFDGNGDFNFGLEIPLIKKGLLGELSSKLPSSCTISNSVFGHINLNYEYILDDEGYPIYISVTKYANEDRETKLILELTYTN